MKREGGFALLIVLWSVVLLALLVTGITAAGRTEVQLAANLRGAAQAEAAADGAVHLAAFHLLDPAAPWRADGRPRQIAVPGALVTLRVTDLAGRVNPNAASRELLRALLQGVGVAGPAADGLAANIAAWRFPRVRGGLAPGLGFGSVDAGPSPEARGVPGGRAGTMRRRGRRFQTLAELSLVLGMTPDVLARLLPHLSLLTDAAPDPVAGRTRWCGGRCWRPGWRPEVSRRRPGRWRWRRRPRCRAADGSCGGRGWCWGGRD